MKEEEKTRTIYGFENTISIYLNCFASSKERLDSCGGNILPSVISTSLPIRNGYLDVLKRGVKTRFITQITEENVAYCKELMNIVGELRHLEGVKGNFTVSESDYIAAADIQEQEQQEQGQLAIPQIIHSNARAMIEQQQYFFETLWSKAISAEQRIRELEDGIKPEVIETIREPQAMQKHVVEMVRSAKEEILVIFSTPNAFRRQERAGTFELLKEAVTYRGLKVRILVPIGDDNNNAVSERIERLKDAGIDIRTIRQTFQNKLTTLIVDQSLCLTVELEDDTGERTDKAIGSATYFDSDTTVFSYVLIFENFWIQTQLHKKQEQEAAAA